MTLRQFMHLAALHPRELLMIFGLLPLLALLLPLLHKRGLGERRPWCYVYAVLTYLTCIPGMFAAVLVGYALFFTHENLLDANLLVYGLPLVSMALTLILLGRQVRFSALPGSERLSGLMLLIAGAFLIALLLQKLYIGIFFGGSVIQLLVIGLGMFLLLRWAAHAVFGAGRRSRS